MEHPTIPQQTSDDLRLPWSWCQRCQRTYVTFLMDKLTRRGMHLITMRQIEQDARRSAHQRQQQVIEVRQRIMALQVEREVDPMALTAAVSQHVARAQVAVQANRNAAAARLRVVDTVQKYPSQSHHHTTAENDIDFEQSSFSALRAAYDG